jgi:hypothetical protein
MNILRSMETFDYQAFRLQLQEQSRSFAPNQKSMMGALFPSILQRYAHGRTLGTGLRLSLLDSCLKDGNLYNRVSSYFKQGQLTIIECVMVDGFSFFEMITNE